MVVSVGQNAPAQAGSAPAGPGQQPGDAPSASKGPPAPPVLDVNNIMGGMEQTAGVRMHNHRRKLRQRFDLVRKLGQGTYGKVQLGINKETGQEVAIKTIKKAKIETEADLVRIRREIQIMSSVRHPNIIHIYEVFENKEKMVLVMEYAAGGELYDYLSQRKVLTETEARRIFRQVASAVYYCHKHKICHRDLKLENILLDEQKCAKIADFGLSNVFDDRRLLTTFCGSPLYASPEIVRGTPYHGPEVDCWSLGVLLYTLVYGAMPFDGSNFKRLVRQISSGEYYEPPDKPSSASPLIRHMLLVDPTKRANVEDICSHWWVNESYGESCLEVAEELANQTPVRLDLLLSLLPPPDSSETVVVDNKMDTSQALSAKESEAGDSMNEYYSASKEKPKAPEETTQASGADKKGVKKKKESSSDGKTDAEQKGSSKRRRAEAADQAESIASDGQMKTDGQKTPPPPVPETVPIAVEPIELADASPVDDSGIGQGSEREEFADARSEASTGQPDVASPAPENKTPAVPEAKLTDEVTNQQQDDAFVDVEMDEGISTSSVAHQQQAISALPAEAEAGVAVVDVAKAETGDEQKVAAASAEVVPAADSAITTGQAASRPDSDKMDAVEAVPSVAAAAETSPAEPPTGATTSPPIPAAESVPEVEKKRSPGPVQPKQTANESETGAQSARRPANSNSDQQPPQSQPQQQRHSKILKQAELFNNLVMNHSRTDPGPKSTMTLERPKKVTIYGFKVNDTKKAFEAPAQQNKPPAIVPVIKVSDAKKAFENTAKLEKEKNAISGHHSLPRRTLIQTPPTIEPSPVLPKPKPVPTAQKNAQPAQQEDQHKPLGVQPGEKVVVGGLGVKIGAIGKVTEIGMNVKTEESSSSTAQVKSPSEESAAKAKSPEKKKKEPSETKAAKKTEESVVESNDKRGKSVHTDQVQQPKETDEKKAGPPEQQSATKESPQKEPAQQQPKTEMVVAHSPEKEVTVKAKQSPECPVSDKCKVREIPVTLDTGDTEPKLVVASGDPSPARELPAQSTNLRPTSPLNQKEEVAKKPVPPSVQAGNKTATLNERVSSPPPLPPAARKSPTPNVVQAISPPPSSRALSPPARALSPPLRTFSPPPANRTLSPPPTGRPLSPMFLPAQIKDRTGDDCIAGSENAFLRSIKSPTRESNTLPRRFSRDPRDIPSPTGAMQETLSEQSKPMQKSEINIALSSSSISSTPRERIIPIKIEGREFTVQSPISSGASTPKVVNSVSVQLRSTPPASRVASPPPFTRVLSPPPFARVGSPPTFRTTPSRAGSTSRQESVQSPPPPVDQRRGDPIRKSPREFIIPISIEGGEASQAANTSSISSSKTRGERTKRYSRSLFSDGDSEFEQSLGNGNSLSNSPLHHLQRFTSFKKSVDEPSDSRGRRGSGSSVDDDDDDDDDDTFQILTAESLFSTLLSRVRQLTRRNQRDNGADPFVMFRNSSRFTSPAPSNSSANRSRAARDDFDETGTPSCTSPVGQNNNNNLSNRNSIAGSDALAETKGFWNNVYSRASSVASESDARRYSTVDTPRVYGDSVSQGATSAPPWRREQSVDSESNCSIASASVSTRGANQEPNSEDPNRPFTSSLTRRVLKQHLKETAQEWPANGNSSDAMSENSSTSGRSSLSRALSKLSSVLGPEAKTGARKDQQQIAYGRTMSSRELGAQQGGAERGRVGSPLSDEEQSGTSNPASYRTFTRTRSREYFSPTSSRGASPTPTGWTSPDPVGGSLNPIMPQLSTVLENGPLGNESENSPRPVRAAETKVAVVVPTSVAASNPASSSAPSAVPPSVPSAPPTAPADGADDRKSRRVSRFLRPDFYDTPRDESTEKPRYLSKSIERYNPDAGLLALSNKASASTGNERVVPVLRATSGSSMSSGSSVPPSPLQPLLLARQNLQPIPHHQPVQQPASNMTFVLKPVELQSPSEASRSIKPTVSPPSLQPIQTPQTPVRQEQTQEPQQIPQQQQPVQQKQPQPPQQSQQQQQNVSQQQQNVPELQQSASSQQIAQIAQNQQQPIEPAPQQSPPPQPHQQPANQTQVKTNGKGSPKLTVRRQFEHLINLAAAQFQRSSSPGKAAQTSNPLPPRSVVSPSAEAISLELKQLEDEIKNTAAIKAQAAARLDALKYEYAAKTGAMLSPPPPPEPSRTPNKTSLADLPIPPEFQPFQYKGSNGVLRELSSMSRRETLTSPKSESRASSYFESDEPVRFARIKRVDQQQDTSWASDMMDGTPGTPTDSYESSSVCSDLRPDKDSGEDESVSERILRKSFYCRFNDSSKVKPRVQQIHRRSVTNKELATPAESVEEVAPPPPQGHISRRSSVNRRSVSGRDESAEAVMVRKFLSTGSETSTFERERRLSTTRRSNVSESSDTADPIRSREASVARSVKSERVTSPTPSEAGSVANGRESRSYLRSYTSRGFANDLPPSGSEYSSASLGRRSYYSSSSSNGDHMNSLPRRTNRYSMHEQTDATLRPSTLGRSGYSPAARYSSIFEETAGSSTRDANHVLSPTSARRHLGTSETMTRRESTFYGVPSSNVARTPASSYFARSTSSGLDHHQHGTSTSTSSASTYATLRPSYLRHRR